MVKRLAVFLLLAVVVLGTSAQSQSVWNFVRELNQARVAQGLSALALNADLTRAAQRHSNDMAGADQLSHTGTDGSEFWDRVQAAGYPLIQGAENVLYRFDADGIGAYRQWRDSPPHRANMMSPAYQELGLAYAQSSSGRFYFTLVLASREDYSSPTVTPTTTPQPSATATQQPVQSIIVATQTFTPRSPATFTPFPSNTAQPAIAQVPRSTWTPMPIMPTRLPTWTPQPAPTATPGPPDEIALFYDDLQFTLKNIAGRPLYLEGLTFESTSGFFQGTRWDSEYLTAPLSAFPADDCLQIWSINTDQLSIPPGCEARHAWATVNDDGLFWIGADWFDVYLFGERITRCFVAESVCRFRRDDLLPFDPTPATTAPAGRDANPPVEPTAQSTVMPAAFTTQDDMTLRYNDDGFVMINTSGRDLNLTGINFASDNGRMSISEWDNGFLSRPLSAFPAGDCLQAWFFEIETTPTKPAVCNVRHAYLAVGDARQFWRNTERFTVSQAGFVLATCEVSAGSCAFDLS